MNLPRGIRSNNPGNIRKGLPWQGLADDQSSDRDFCVFSDATWGIRAIARILITYQDEHNLNTVRSIISRWAPPVENDTWAYVSQVAQALGVGPDDVIDVHSYAHLEPLVRAIIRHENGNPVIFDRGSRWYAQWQIDEGLHRAGVVPSIPATRTVKVMSAPEVIGTGVAGTAGLSAAAAALNESASSLRMVSEGNVVITVVVTLMIIIGVGLTIYGVIRRSRQ